MVLALLRKRAPDSQRIAALCRIYKAPELPRLSAADAGKCILCGLCVRACTELSVGAISTVNRGVLKEIATPYHEASPVCVGCGACASVCPTQAIPSPKRPILGSSGINLPASPLRPMRKRDRHPGGIGNGGKAVRPRAGGPLRSLPQSRYRSDSGKCLWEVSPAPPRNGSSQKQRNRSGGMECGQLLNRGYNGKLIRNSQGGLHHNSPWYCLHYIAWF